MKRASYRKAIEFIALNDEAGASWAHDPIEVVCMVSVILTATIFGVPSSKVASDVVIHRNKIARGSK